MSRCVSERGSSSATPRWRRPEGSSASAAASTARRMSSFANDAVVPSASRGGGRHRLGTEEVTAVEAEQREPAVSVGQRDLGGQVDAPGSLRQGQLEVFDPVRRQDEGHVGVGVEAVEGVEHLEEQG